MRIINNYIASNLRFIDKSTIKRGDDGKEIDKGNIVDKANTETSKAGTKFLTLKTRLSFIELIQAFYITLILHYSDLEYHIWIKTDVSHYTISSVFSQLNLNSLKQWHLVVFFSQKIILVET